MWGILARTAKLAALLCFLLPWTVLSCSRQDIATLSGLDLARGHAVVTSPIDQSVQTFQGDPYLPILAALVAAALALALSLLTRRRIAAALLLAGALAGAGLSIWGQQGLEAEIAARAEAPAPNEDAFTAGLRAGVWSQVRAAPGAGYGAALALFALTGVLSCLALAGVRGFAIVREQPPPPAG